MLVPSIAIVIPAFNVEAYVKEALDSVLHQTVAADEVIVIDDGSTDTTPEIIRAYRNFSGWKIVRSLNQGVGSARNFGRALSNSAYIHFFDSDDILKPGFIARMKELIRQYESPDMILFAGETFRDSNCDSNFSPNYRRTIEGFFKSGDRLLSLLAERREDFSQPCLYLTKASLWSKNRISYPATLHEDESVLYPLLAVSERTLAVTEVFFERRIHLGSIMTSARTGQNTAGVLRALNETIEFMAQNAALVAVEADTWSRRISKLCTGYIHLCKSTGQSIVYGVVFSALFAVQGRNRWVILYALSPKRFRHMLSRIRRWAISV